MNAASRPSAPRPAQSSAGFWIGAAVFAAVALFFLLSEHRAHLVGALPWLLVLACPLIHLFLHRGHRHADGTQPEFHTDGGDREHATREGDRS